MYACTLSLKVFSLFSLPGKRSLVNTETFTLVPLTWTLSFVRNDTSYEVRSCRVEVVDEFVQLFLVGGGYCSVG